MASAGHIVVLDFSGAPVSRLRAWRHHAAAIVGARAPQLDEPGAVSTAAVWQLSSPNNRVLARSALVFPTAAEALASARRAVDSASGLAPVLTRNNATGELGWYLAAGAEPVATCSRWYLADRDRRKSLDAAVVAFGSATIGGTARSIEPPAAGRPKATA